jgi:hypothetical protein
MNPTTPSGENITSTSPSSILRDRLKTHEEGYLLCVERLPEVLQQIADWSSETFPDLRSIDAAIERKEIWELRIEGHTLLVDLCDKVDANPFPGLKLSVMNVAVKLSPEVKSLKWWAIFKIYDIDASWRIYFPVAVEELNVAQLELELLKLAGERDAVPVIEAKKVLLWVPTSKTYQTAKRALEERGWEWKVRKVESRVEKVICVPRR